MRKIGLYPRISIEEPDFKKKDGSISSQIYRMNQKVEHKNLAEGGKWGRVVDVYKDDGHSAKDTNRPEFQRMMADVRRGRVDTIMVTELSRISRSVTDFLRICNELSEYGCDFICLQIEGFDTTTPIGKFILTVMIALYQLEREMTAERISNNFFVRATKGLTNGGHPFLGYDKHPTEATYVINPEESHVVNKIFDLYLEGKFKGSVDKNVDDKITSLLSSFEIKKGGLTVAQIATFLNQLGHRKKKWTTKNGVVKGGELFDHSSIHRILTNYSYAGIREINKLNKAKDQEKLKENQRYRQEKASWEAIIEREKFERVQKKLQINKKVTKPAHHDYILSGVLRCSECGKALYGASATGQKKMHHYYQHKKKEGCKIHRYPAIELEKLIKKEFFKIISNEAHQKSFLEMIKKVNKSKLNQNSLIPQYEKKLKELDGQKRNLTHVIATTDTGGVQALVNRLKEIEGEIKAFESKKLQVEADEARAKFQEINGDYIIERLKLFRADNFRKKSINAKREILQSVTRTIYLDPDNVIRVDFWGKMPQQEGKAKKRLAEFKGTILPFSYFGGPLSKQDEEECEEIGAKLKKGNNSFEIIPLFFDKTPQNHENAFEAPCSDAITVGGRDKD